MKTEENSQGHPFQKAKGVAFNTNTITWCNRFITIGFYLLFGLVPLLLTPWNYELFEYNKMMAVYIVTALIVTSWVVKSIAQKEIRIARSPLDIPIMLFVSSQVLSAVFSIDPHVSWLGYYSRFNGGMWSTISYILLFYAYMSNRTDKTYESNMLKTALASATLVAIYGVLERLGIDKNLWVQDVQNRVFSTLGQPNWLAAYLVALVPLTMALALKKPLWYIISLLFFTVLLFTRSRSGLLGFAVADAVFWGLIFIRPPLAADKNRKGVAFFRLPVILHILFASIVFINGTGIEKIDRYFSWKGLSTRAQIAKPAPASGPALEVGGTESGEIRKYVWQGAVNAWKSSTKTMAIGTGVETFAFAFYQHRPAGHNLTSEWDFLYNKAHNEYLNYLATTGVLGLGSYLLFIGTFIYWFLKKFLSSNFLISKQILSTKSQLGQLEQLEIRSISLALFAGWFSILVTNFFGFSVVVVQLGLFLFPALIFSLSQNIRLSTKHIALPTWSIWIAMVVGIYIVVHISSFWQADKLFAAGYHAVRSGNAGVAAQSIQKAVTLNSDEPLFHDELASIYASLAVGAFEAKNATGASELAALAVAENARALTISPHNVNYWKTRTKVYYTLSALDPALNVQAIEALNHALALSPNDAKIYYNLAILTGRTGDADTAIVQLEKAKKLKKNYRDVYFALHVFYTEKKLPVKARAILSEYLDTVDPTDKEFLEKTK